jgi:hypothetical protein
MEEKKLFTINNTFLIIAMGFGFWLVLTVFFIYGFFFAGKIDWNQEISVLEIIQFEISKSARPMLVVIFWIIATVWAIKDFRNLIRTPKYLTTLGDDYFEHVPMVTESKYIKHDEVFAIKKSFFPLYGNRAETLHISHIFLLLVIPVSQIIFFITYVQKVIYWVYLKLFTNEPCKFMFFSCVLVFKDPSNVININLLHAKDYQKLDDYFKKYFDKEIAKLPINTTLVKTRGENNGRK